MTFNELEWNEKNLLNLGRTFLRNVRDNMNDIEGATVRFGETGQGIQPNYQIVFPNGRTKVIRGSSHKNFEQADEFNPERISKAFSLQDIKRAYESVSS